MKEEIITVIHKGEEIASGRTMRALQDRFKLRIPRSLPTRFYFNKPLFSKNFNINVILIPEERIWQSISA